METVEDHPTLDIANVIKSNIIEEQSVAESNVCHKSNGVDCDVQAEGELSEANDVQPELEVKQPNGSEVESATPEDESVPGAGETAAVAEAESEMPVDYEGVAPDEPDSNVSVDAETEVLHDNELAHVDEIQHEVITETVIESEKEICIEDGIVTETMVEMESSISTVHFETEVLVEENDADVSEKLLADSQEADHTNNILNELGPNIELSEVLRSSDISENVENNNSAVKQEIFNKEELLDILEGNDNMEQTVDKVTEISTQVPDKIKEAEIAMQQLSRLKNTSRRREQKIAKSKREKTKSPQKDASRMSNSRNSERAKRQTVPDQKQQDAQVDNKQVEHQADSEEQSQHDTEQESQSEDAEVQVENQQTSVIDQLKSHPENIVKTLVMDWEDDPTDNNGENDDTFKEGENDDTFKEGETFIKELEELKNNQESVISKVSSDNTVTETPSSESTTKLIKTEEECPTRRISRVIKKKVIFDPDNPDTFTKGKSSKTKETHVTKEQTPAKKGKSDQTIQRSKSKSPVSKLQWKKPSAKNSKQCKRLSEVDRLLMDEGAVNMIYQLTPEAPKGKKNVRTKAEFIKKIQSSTPDSKEVMKFRERKKESKYDEGEARRLLGGKHRTSLSSSVKSPAVSEDFETHSADDSIIYRRHSSSSYSSSCMSPRRLSDVEAGSAQHQHATRLSQQPVAELEPAPKETVNEETAFQTESPKPITSEMINKNDCLSIKEKLNSKLSLALNKRKRESTKNEKPAKQKKIKPDESVQGLSKEDDKLNQFNFISVTFDQRLALVGIKKTGLKICVEILKELEEVMNYIDNRDDISVTLLESQCGTLCSSLDLSLLLDDNRQIRVNHAYELADSVRLVLQSLARHRKLVVCGAWGACAGVALALVALSDVALASERASFWLAAAAAPALPGAAALTARCPPLPKALVNDLVIFGRRLSASEALQGGLVSRVLWPDRFDDQVLNIAKDIAAQPLQAILLKKKLLSVAAGNSEAELTFLASLELERDLLVEYWTSVEGQQMLRDTLDAA